jgi:hypothetical protein
MNAYIPVLYLTEFLFLLGFSLYTDSVLILMFYGVLYMTELLWAIPISYNILGNKFVFFLRYKSRATTFCKLSDKAILHSTRYYSHMLYPLPHFSGKN